jgi:hypothetical protein
MLSISNISYSVSCFCICISLTDTYDPKAKKSTEYTINIHITDCKLTQGSVLTGYIIYKGNTYTVNTDPALTAAIWNDFKGTVTIDAIQKIGNSGLDAYKNLIKSAIYDALPPDWRDGAQMSEFLVKYGKIIKKFYALSK